MIKKVIFLMTVLGGMLMTACEEQDIMVFGDEHMVYFEKFWHDSMLGNEKSDSTQVTFYFNEAANTTQHAELVVVLAGRKLERDAHFRLRVVDELTTALPEDYILQDEYTFRALPVRDDALQMQDTIRIQLNRTSHLQSLEDGFRLVLEIVPSEALGVGQYERSRAIIYVSKNPVRPEWWNIEVSTYLLGTYSPLKYKLFLENVPGARELNKEIIEDSPDWARKLALDFKKWLIENPTYDEDGSLLDVPV